MKVINLDRLVENHAMIKIRDREFMIHEPTLRQWAEFQTMGFHDRVQKEPLKMYLYLIGELCPDLMRATEGDGKLLDNMTMDEVVVTATACHQILVGGVVELGKKLRPLDQLMEIQDPVADKIKRYSI
jgi:hypothetical protein